MVVVRVVILVGLLVLCSYLLVSTIKVIRNKKHKNSDKDKQEK